MIQYSLSDFSLLMQNMVDIDLPEETLSVIENLSKQVGAPEYIKTPQFKNKTQNLNPRRKKKQSDINDDDWETIRNFQTTEFKKNEGVEKNLDIIRKNLNMITLSKYEEIKNNIIKEINFFSDNKNEIEYLSEQIFKIISTNILYSEIYAHLYKDLINNFSIFQDILDRNFDNIDEIFQTITYFSPEENYNKFCENNRTNEIRRAICTFYINLMKEKIIDNEKIGLIILNLFKTLYNFISLKDKTNEIDELSELLYILIVNSYEDLIPDHAKKIHDNVIIISNMKLRNEPGITNKCIFKHMDILDDIE